MPFLQCFVLLLLCIKVSCSNDTIHCPTWMWFNHTSEKCECGKHVLKSVQCNEDTGTVFTRIEYCISWDSSSEKVVLGFCKYKTIGHISHRVYSELPQNPENLSDIQCSPNNRDGFLCGKCKEGYAVSTSFLDTMCINCSNCLQNPTKLVLFIIAEFVPLTLFILIIVVFRVNITSGHLLGYVIFCQAHINATHNFSNLFKLLLNNSGQIIQNWNQYVLFPLSGIWNLNFFSILLPLCYSCHLNNNLMIILMQYFSVLYVFLLLAFIHIISRQSLRNTKVAPLKCCKAIKHCFIRWRRNWSTSDSTIHAYATFIALLFAKVGVISSQILTLSHLHGVNGTVMRRVSTFEPSIDGYSPLYSTYAIAGYIPLVIFGILPSIVLCLHPNRRFQKLLRYSCRPRKRIILNIFVDTFWSGFRDGLDGGRDYRRVYPITMIVIVGLIFTGHNVKYNIFPDVYFIIFFLFFTILAFAVSYFRPCKTVVMNVSLSFHFIIIGLSALTFALWFQDFFLDAKSLGIALTVFLTLPHVVMFFWLLYNIVDRCEFLRICFQKTKFWKTGFLLQRCE